MDSIARKGVTKFTCINSVLNLRGLKHVSCLFSNPFSRGPKCLVRTGTNNQPMSCDAQLTSGGTALGKCPVQGGSLVNTQTDTLPHTETAFDGLYY